MNKIKVALVGNPNIGKTSLFNALTGLNQKVGNFAGVTIEKRSGFVKIDAQTQLEIIDLPGTYSIAPKSLDEQIVFDVLADANNESHPDVVVMLADASNLKRNLLFITQIIDLHLPVVLCLNMIDVAHKNGLIIHYLDLEKELNGIKVVATNARKQQGIEDLKQAILQTYRKDFDKQEVFIADTPPNLLADVRQRLGLANEYTAFQILQSFETAMWLSAEQKNELRAINAQSNIDFGKLHALETINRYQRIAGIMSRTIQRISEPPKQTITKRIDKILTHHFWGYVFFLMILTLMFQAIYNWATYPMDLIELSFNTVGAFIGELLPDGWLKSLLINGILAGLSGVVIFLPQIILLFAFLAILEDTGYMARVSFLMDNFLKRIGLNGKSVVPLMSGLACAVPAIMATRNIGSWKERLITILVVPLMSCSARLPVYTLLISLVIPDIKIIGGFFNLQGLVLMGFYLLGFLMAIVASLVMQRIIISKQMSFFVLELPVYRSPRWKNIVYTLIEKSKSFLFDAGKVIIAISIVLWLLCSFAPDGSFALIEQKYASDTSLTAEQQDATIAQEKLEKSYAGILGKWIEPSIEPLGFNWKIGIALITSFAAREVFVGTMATIYNSSGNDLDISHLKDKMRAEINPRTGQPVYTLATGISLMVFYAFAMQCLSTMAITIKETGGWKWAIVQLVYMTGLAYVMSFLVYQCLK